MAREFSRASRISDQVQRDLADLVRLELRDPGIGLVTITAVEVSRDLSHARVFITSLQGADAIEASLLALRRASGFLRSRLARSMKTRTVPELHFEVDESVDRGVRLSRLIDEAVQSDQSADEADPS